MSQFYKKSYIVFDGLLKAKSHPFGLNTKQTALTFLFCKRIDICIPIYTAKERCKHIYSIFDIT